MTKTEPQEGNWISINSRTNYVKAKIDSTQNSKCRLSCDRDEMVNHKWMKQTGIIGMHR